MFPIDSVSVRQLHDADMLTAEQARTRHPVARPRSTRWRPELKVLTRGLLSMVATRRPAPGPLTATHELFAGLDAAELERLGQYLTIVRVPAGRSLGRQGALAREFVTVIDGQVGVTIDGIPNAVFDSGSHFGALPLLEDEMSPTHRASFSTMVPSRIAVAGPAEFRGMLRDFPTVADRIHAMTKIRRAYLNGLADARVDDHVPVEIIQTVEYPAHIAA